MENNKVIQQIANRSQQTTQAGQTNYSQAAAVNLLNQVFTQLKGIFPAWQAALKTPEAEAEAKRQWLQGLIESGITSDEQINAGLAKCRAHNSPFMPSVGQFVSWCNQAMGDQHPPFEACYAELTAFVRNGRKDTYNLTPILYHTITRNLDFYHYKNLEKEWERIKAFEIAYKATLFQLESGESLDEPPAPETLISHSVSSKPASKDVQVAEATMSDILALFGSEDKPKPKTAKEIEDDLKLQKIKLGEI